MRLLAFALMTVTALQAMVLGFVWRQLCIGFRMGSIANDQAWEYVMEDKHDGDAE